MRRNRLFILSPLLISIAAIPAWAQGAAVGPESACVSCHRAQSQTQPQTPMARALQLPNTNPTLKNHTKLTIRKGAYSYTVETQGGESTYSVSDGTRTISIPIHWNFGEGAQTWVLERDGHRYESTVSFYPSIAGLDYTTGDEDLKPHTLEDAIGREIAMRETKVCFGCHATNSFSNGKMAFDTLRPGVKCEHCHAGASAHVSDAVNGDLTSVPPDLRKLPAEDISNFCGQCHRTWETVVRNHWRGDATVRFQPYRLANSRCFDGADARISCIACHDPHQDVVRNDASYDVNCLACHSPAAPAAITSTAARTPKACPVAKANCVTCHMPKVKLPNGLMTFTDHQIRVIKAGEPFPN